MVSYAINKKQKTLQLKIGYNRNRNRAQNPPCLRFAFSSVMYCVQKHGESTKANL